MSPLELDDAVLRYARTHGHARPVERAIAGYSKLGEHAACWLALGAAGAVLDRSTDRRRRWGRGLRVVAAAYGLNYAVKVSVRRRRPELDGLPPLTSTVSTLSFPSAHSTTSFAAADAFAGLVSPAVLYVAATAFALSRPYLGVHYPSDVIAGAILGTAIATAWPSAR